MKTPQETAGGALASPIQNLRVTDIVPDPNNRKNHDKTELQTLADSITRDGLLQPIIVRPVSAGKYMLIAGERRWLAHQLNKTETIEARVSGAVSATVTVEAVRKRAAENFHRVDLSPIEKAKQLQELFELKMTQSEIAAFVGAKDQSTVSNLCRLLRLPKDVQELVHTGELTAAHAKALLRFEKHPKLLAKLSALVVENGASSKMLEKGIPFVDELRTAGLVHEFNWRVAEMKDLPKEYEADPDFIEGENQYQETTVICLDPSKGQKVAKQVEDAENAANAAAASKSKNAAGCMTDAQKKERAKKIADNRAARAKIDEAFSKARTRLERVTALDSVPEVLHVVLESAATQLGESLKTAAALLGVTIGPGVRKAGLYRVFEHEELQALAPHDALRVVAMAITLKQCEDAKRYSAEVPDCAAHIAAAAVPVFTFGVGDLVRWKTPRRDCEGHVISAAEYQKITGIDWGKGGSRFTPVRITKGLEPGALPVNGIVTEALILITRHVPPPKAPASLAKFGKDAKQATKKPAPKKAKKGGRK